MSITINPGKPAVTETRVLEAAVPATVTIEVSLHEALLLAAVQGRMTGSEPATVYRGLASHALFREYYTLVGDAIAYRLPDVAAQNPNVSLHAFYKRVDKLRELAEVAA